MTQRSEREQAQANIAENRKAFHDYHILDTYEAGVALLGTEVKAIREGRVNLRDSYASIDKGEVFLNGVNISSYSHRGYADHEPLRRRKLLLHKLEILKLTGKVAEKGMTLVPLRMYFKNGRVKVAVGVAKGKKEDAKKAGYAANVEEGLEVQPARLKLRYRKELVPALMKELE